MSINLNLLSISQIIDLSDSPIFPDHMEIFGENTCVQKSSEIKSLSFISTKFMSYDSKFPKKDFHSSISDIFQIEIIFQSISIFIKKIMKDSFDIFPDQISLMSIKNSNFGKVQIGDIVKIIGKVNEISNSLISFEIWIEKHNEKISEGIFSFKLEYSKENSLCIIKPDAVKAGLAEQILSVIQENKIKIVSSIKSNGNVDLLRRQKVFNENDCRSLYAEHLQRPFYPEIQAFMTSGESIVCVLEGPYINGVGCIKRYRELMGATDPREALPGTIRHFAGLDKGQNAVHGSDSPAAAAREIPIFFPEIRIWSKLFA